MTNNYELKLSSKTRFLNLFRRILKIRFLEEFFAGKTQNLTIESWWLRLMPPNYLYPANSRREVERKGIKYSLDISDYMEHGVYFGYSEAAQDELLRLGAGKNVIIDVGVNLGATLMNFARCSPTGVIIGFEPDEKNFRKAERNLDLNNFGNVELYRNGLGAETATVKLFKVNPANQGMNRIFDDRETSIEKDLAYEKIEIIRLDDFVNEHQVDRIDLIKIDVEGYEFKVLQGAEQSLLRYRPILFIELDDENLKAQNDSAELLISFLKKIGYTIYRADNKQEVKLNSEFGNCHFDIVCEC